MFHRSIETSFTAQVLRRIFDAGNRFRHHSPLPPVNAFGDEGAANHTRLCRKHGESGLHLFVYGFAPFGEDSSRPRRFPARQSLEASRAIARLHGIPGRRAVFLQQAPEAIDAGAFHNDVVAVGNEDLFLFHEQAFAGGGKAVAELAGAFERQSGTPLQWLEIPAARLSLEEAIRTYFFNSQLISLPEGGMLLVAPEECRGSAVLRNLIGELPDRSGGRIRGARFVGIRQSMRNGGGPACLRMRVPLSPEERGALAGRLFLDDALYAELCAWVERNYREELRPPDLADPELLDETRRALDELSRLLLLPNLYRFQQQ